MQDILLDNNNDLKIVNGDFDIGVSDYQQQKLIVATHKGEWKEHPEVGVGITQMIADDLYTEMLIEIKKQLEYDGMQIDNVSLKENGKLFIDGFYK
ncbi:oxidase [Capnocytophaga canimorsus]